MAGKINPIKAAIVIALAALALILFGLYAVTSPPIKKSVKGNASQEYIRQHSAK